MTIVERIERILEAEEQTRARCRQEITVDPAEVTAEIRAGALRDVLRVLKRYSGCPESIPNNEVTT